jgi:Fur family transcriptional regulator, iron response regulator
LRLTAGAARMKKLRSISNRKSRAGRTEVAERIKSRLLSAGLQPTRTRVALGLLLFGNSDRHLTAESLVEEAWRSQIPVSVTTIHNTLKRFAEAGFLRQVPIDSTKSYFDTNTKEHHHLYIEKFDRLIDISPINVSGKSSACTRRLRNHSY